MLRFADFQLSVGTLTAIAFVAAVTSGLAAYLLRNPARAAGLAAKSRRDRFGEGGVALVGGPALALGVVVALAALRPAEAMRPAAVALLFFAVGLLDDFLEFKPPTKLGLQIGAAGIGALLLGSNVGVSIVVLLLIVNACNYLDNMDGLLVGVALTTGVCLLLLPTGAHVGAVLLVWTLPGILFFNIAPARIYLGDSGSHLIGALLAIDVIAVVGDPARSVRVDEVLALLLLFAVPIADVVTVTISRRQRGRSIFRGGTDHLSHRLVRGGASVPGAVGLLVLASAVCGIAALVLFYRSS